MKATADGGFMESYCGILRRSGVKDTNFEGVLTWMIFRNLSLEEMADKSIEIFKESVRIENFKAASTALNILSEISLKSEKFDKRTHLLFLMEWHKDLAKKDAAGLQTLLLLALVKGWTGAVCEVPSSDLAKHSMEFVGQIYGKERGWSYFDHEAIEASLRECLKDVKPELIKKCLETYKLPQKFRKIFGIAWARNGGYEKLTEI